MVIQDQKQQIKAKHSHNQQVKNSMKETLKQFKQNLATIHNDDLTDTINVHLS